MEQQEPDSGCPPVQASEAAVIPSLMGFSRSILKALQFSAVTSG